MTVWNPYDMPWELVVGVTIGYVIGMASGIIVAVEGKWEYRIYRFIFNKIRGLFK